jgi:hypothetical protein
MAATSHSKSASRRAARTPKRSNGTAGRPGRSSSAAKKANLPRRRKIDELKADARSNRIGPAALLADPRAQKTRILTLLSVLPGCNQRLVLEALLACQINGARRCDELTADERSAISEALLQVGHGIALPPPRAMPSQSEGDDRELDREQSGAPAHAPSVELAPSEFVAARRGLERDPTLMRMVDRLVDAVRFYVERDDGGRRARVVAEQWIKFRNYDAKVVSGEYPPPSQCGPAVLE